MSTPILSGERLERFWKQRIRNAGFSPEMFMLRTDKPKDAIHREQYVAAMTIFYSMYCNPKGKVSWVHLVAEMQAGKTGVCDALVRIIRRNVEDGKMPEDLYLNIFVVTGLSDCSWVKQTRERLPRGVNVYHGATLGKMQVQLKALAERPDGLRNTLIIVDESHVASAKNNRPYKCIYSEVRSCLPDAKTWADRNVHFLTVSATDPHAVLMMAEADMPASAVALETTDKYQSVGSLRNAGRIRNASNIGSSPETIEMLREAVDAYEAPRYHIIRAEGKLNPVAVDMLKVEFPESRVMSWDAKTKGGAVDGSMTSENDINEMLSAAPEVTTFIVIKRMFSCAKTMVDRHVGVLWDYVSEWDDKDSVRLQSLLGRACGYGRSKDTVVYTSMRVVDDYLEHWRDVMRSVDVMRAAREEAPEGGNWKNVGVVEKRGKLVRTERHVAPVVGPEVVDEQEPDDCECEWSDIYDTLESARRNGWGKNGMRMKKNDLNFFNNRLPGRDHPMTRAEYESVRRAKNSWLARPRGSERSQVNIVFYEDPTDPSTARFVYKTVWRKAVDPGAVGPAAAGGLPA